MAIEIKAVESVEIKFKGNSYKLELPTVGDLKEAIGLTIGEEDSAGNLDYTIKMLVKAGIPEDVVVKMKPFEVDQIAEVLAGKHLEK